MYWLAWGNFLLSLPLIPLTFFAGDELRLLLTTLLSVYAVTLTGLFGIAAARADRRLDPDDDMEHV